MQLWKLWKLTAFGFRLVKKAKKQDFGIVRENFRIVIRLDADEKEWMEEENEHKQSEDKWVGG